MEKELYDFSSYKDFLNEVLDAPPLGGRGARARLSEVIGCQTSYTAQVLRGSAHFSLEQAEQINAFLGHNETEAQYFLSLVQYERSATPALKRRFEKQMQSIQQSRLVLKNRLKIEAKLSLEHQVVYYSAWYYAAVHAAASLEGLQSLDAIARRLRLSKETTSEVIEFLLSTGLIARAKSQTHRQFEIGTTQIHLGSDSALLTKHHVNWRLQAIRSLEAGKKENLHYSSVVSLSEKDALRIRENLVKSIQGAKKIIQESPEEKLYSLDLDFFEI